MSARRAVAWTLASGALVAGARVAAADHAEVVLRYTVDVEGGAEANAGECPSEARLRELVTAELGYDPFVAESASTVRLRITGAAPRFVADIAYEGQGTPATKRRLEAARCAELASSAAFAVALAVDPDVIARPPPSDRSEASPTAPAHRATPARRPPPATVAPSRKGPNEPDVSPAAKPLEWTVSAGARAGAGLVPGVSFGPHAGLSIGGDLWSVGAEFQAFLPGATHTTFADVSASIVRGALAPCFRLPAAPWASVALCGHASAGALFGEAAGVSRATPSTDVHVAFGPRAHVDLQPWEIVGFRLGGELDVAATRVHLEIDDGGVRREAWVTPVVAALGEVSVLARFR